MERRIRTTYDITTPESAAEGDYAESGWVDEEGEVIERDDEADERTIAEIAAAWLLGHGGGLEPSCWPTWSPGVWYTSEARQDMYTGNYESESFHLVGFTEEEERGIYRLVVGRDPVTGRREV